MTYAQLRTHASRRAIEAALASGYLRRVARGWYAFPSADRRVTTALSAGGRLGCLTGCSFHGLWTPHDRQTHIVFGRGCRPTPDRGLVIHPCDDPQPSTPQWSLLDCLTQVAHRHDLETAVVVWESALHLGLVTASDVSTAASQLPLYARRFAHYLQAAESGSESRVRLFLQRRGVPIRPQVYLPGIGRVDGLVGGKLIIECDSDEHHSSKEQQREDRRRDLAARDRGYDVLRLSSHQVWRVWPATQLSLLHQIRTRAHRSR